MIIHNTQRKSNGSALLWGLIWLAGITALTWAAVTMAMPRFEKKQRVAVVRTVADLSNAPVSMGIKGFTATLSGEVPDENSRLAIINSLGVHTGVLSVKDQLRVAEEATNELPDIALDLPMLAEQVGNGAVPIPLRHAENDQMSGTDGAETDSAAKESDNSETMQDTMAVSDAVVNNTNVLKPDAASTEDADKPKLPSISIRVAGDTLAINGLLTTNDDPASLIRLAMDSFDIDVVSNGIVVDETAASSDWLVPVERLVPMLASLKQAKLEVVRRQITLSGIAPDIPTHDAIISEALASLSDYSLIERISIEDPSSDGDTAPASTEDLQLANQPQAAEAEKAAEAKRVDEAEKAAEAERIAEAEKAAEAERIAEAERAAEAERIAEAERAAEAERIAEAEKAAEAKRIAEAEKAAEAERIAEAEKAAEAERIAEAEKAAMAERIAEAEKAAEAEKIAEAEKAAEAERIAEAEKAAEAEKIAEAEKAAEAERIAEAEKAAEAERIAEAEKAAEAEKIAEAEKAAEAERIAEAEKAAEAERIAEAEKAAEAEKVAEAERIAEAEKIAEAKKAAEAERIAEAEKAAEAERIAEAEKAAEAERIAEAEKAAEAEKIAEAEKAAEANRLAEAEKLAEPQIDLPNNKKLQKALSELPSLRISFESDSNVLADESLDVLNQIADILISFPDTTVSIDGHTDSTGSNEINLELSLARATMVRSYLVERGVSVFMLRAKGFGEEMPIANNQTAAGRALNRRIEFKF